VSRQHRAFAHKPANSQRCLSLQARPGPSAPAPFGSRAQDTRPMSPPRVSGFSLAPVLDHDRERGLAGPASLGSATDKQHGHAVPPKPRAVHHKSVAVAGVGGPSSVAGLPDLSQLTWAGTSLGVAAPEAHTAPHEQQGAARRPNHSLHKLSMGVAASVAGRGEAQPPEPLNLDLLVLHRDIVGSGDPDSLCPTPQVMPSRLAALSGDDCLCVSFRQGRCALPWHRSTSSGFSAKATSTWAAALDR
jgi:hypothetical protein